MQPRKGLLEQATQHQPLRMAQGLECLTECCRKIGPGHPGSWPESSPGRAKHFLAQISILTRPSVKTCFLSSCRVQPHICHVIGWRLASRETGTCDFYFQDFSKVLETSVTCDCWFVSFVTSINRRTDTASLGITCDFSGLVSGFKFTPSGLLYSLKLDEHDVIVVGPWMFSSQTD